MSKNNKKKRNNTQSKTGGMINIKVMDLIEVAVTGNETLDSLTKRADTLIKKYMPKNNKKIDKGYI